ncbi:MAG: hypothetical protein UV00_C0003G0092 [candidate division WWE3 bacterium GW2011_GWF1_42_14]|uniref:Uncharacterized protein n=2 Tax=Katanobacteria TaxID=422282 RepID=A0A0G0YRK6_UNCKA|nr:MAG: hypothetical protein UU92_C0005G0092 [candidate division WWE3 bacterium GW2011_GWA1_42_12]KKS39260.1 MAG: hypothetical protein UV00_C0003G0092 [candidate division WWE3 bacterium GW2011_GWF1_42_14]KKS40758.1 MAG: hypothetical protein UV03_C0003G0071 [candidate division WWE3 bacterium GW2011_GWE1_42_16]KKS65316.1 MAG: hypothetical protein UV35_C0044G0001 [candidate division WWE3 bacterium GW2011_GWB1_42_6]
MIVFFAFLLIIIGGGLFVILNKDPTGTAANTFNTVAEKVTKPLPATSEGSETEGSIVPEGWRVYSNADLKFSINYPKTVYSQQGSCEKQVEGQNTSYRFKTAQVPVKIFEDTDGIFIYPEFRNELSGAKTVDNVSYFSSCEKVTTTLSWLKSETKSWHIIAKSVPTKEDLETFVQTKFGVGCSVGTMTSTAANNKVYDVKILGDGLELGESLCGINYIYVLKYVPEAKMVYTYDLGQAYTFAKDTGGSEYYDEEMNNSFQPIF